MTPSGIEPAVPQPTMPPHDPNQYPNLRILHVDMTIPFTVRENKFQMSIWMDRDKLLVAQWLRHCATNWKVAGSIPDGVTEIIHWHNPSGHTMALGSTQPLREMSTRNISWGKGGRCVVLTTLPPSFADCLNIWESQRSWNPQSLSRPVMGLLYLYING
jgi:hypothetical protein